MPTGLKVRIASPKGVDGGSATARQLKRARGDKDSLVCVRNIHLIDYLDHGVSPDELRRRASVAYEGSARVLKKEEDWIISLKQWSITISAVFDSGNPAGAADRVKNWAKSIRGEFN